MSSNALRLLGRPMQAICRGRFFDKITQQEVIGHRVHAQCLGRLLWQAVKDGQQRQGLSNLVAPVPWSDCSERWEAAAWTGITLVDHALRGYPVRDLKERHRLGQPSPWSSASLDPHAKLDGCKSMPQLLGLRAQARAQHPPAAARPAWRRRGPPHWR